MFSYYKHLFVNNTNNYGFVKSEVIRYNESHLKLNERLMVPMDWIKRDHFTQKVLPTKYARSLRSITQKSGRKINNFHDMGKSKHKGNGKKCNIKKKLKRGSKFIKMHKKYFLPLVLGFLIAKGLLIPVALKIITLMSAKGLFMSFFSTIVSSLLALRSIFDNHGHQRKNNTKTQVELIHIPTKSDDYYYDDYYNRNDVIHKHNKC